MDHQTHNDPTSGMDVTTRETLQDLKGFHWLGSSYLTVIPHASEVKFDQCFKEPNPVLMDRMIFR
jgi:hypothetical protein